MKRIECEFEADVLAAALQSRWPERVDTELRAHVSTCDICSDVATVAVANGGVARRLDPFVTGGYTLAFDPLAAAFGSRAASNGANLGFGLNYWFLRHVGTRAEFREIVIPGSLPGITSWGIRGGIAFR